MKYTLMLIVLVIVSCSKVELPKPTNTQAPIKEVVATCENLVNRDKTKAYVFNQRAGIVLKLYSNSFISFNIQTNTSKDMGPQTVLIKGCRIDLDSDFNSTVTDL